MNECPNQDITSLVEKIMKQSLIKLKKLPNEKDKKSNDQFKLIFPKYRDKEDKVKKEINPNSLIRYSEQEARFLFCREIEYLFLNRKDNDVYSDEDKNLTNSMFYSVETPTEKTYLFKYDNNKKETKNDDEKKKTETKSSSGSIDICIYNNAFKRNNCIEFKCSNVVEASIQKDFEKLIRESGDNFFIHILKTYDEKTINNIITKYKKSFKNLSCKTYQQEGAIEKKNITIEANSLTMYIFIIESVENKSTMLKLKKIFNFKDNIESLEDYMNLNCEDIEQNKIKSKNWGIK